MNVTSVRHQKIIGDWWSQRLRSQVVQRLLHEVYRGDRLQRQQEGIQAVVGRKHVQGIGAEDQGVQRNRLHQDYVLS